MSFGTLALDVARYLRVGRDDDILYEIKTLINEAIVEFLRSDSWLKTEVQKIFTLTGADEYLISAIVIPGTDPAFFNERQLSQVTNAISEVVMLQEKITTYAWATTSNKTNKWAIDATKLFVLGDQANLTFFYNSAGVVDQFIIDDKASEALSNLVLDNYADVIKKYTAWLFQIQYGDDESALKEQNSLQRKLTQLKAHENRIRKNGANVTISSHNR